MMEARMRRQWESREESVGLAPKEGGTDFLRTSVCHKGRALQTKDH